MDRSGHLLLELYRGARECPVPEFQEMALRLLNDVLRFDSGMWGYGEVVPGSGLAVQAIHLHRQPTDMLAAYAEIKAHDLVAFEASRHIGETCNFNCHELMSNAGQDVFDRHRRKYGMENLLVTAVEDKETSSQGFLSLWRASETDRYSEEERRLGAFLMPHLLEAGAINRQLLLNRMTETVVANRGARAICGCLGNILTGDTEFVATLRKEWPDWSPPILPRPLMLSLTQSSDHQYVGRQIAVTMSVVQDMLFLRARSRMTVETLTPAERSVASLVANGLSYKQTAQQLKLSPATVRNQLHSVYLKLGLTNKAALARHFDEIGI
jgi:DNA-binding CsgD family transcriptional regulator